MKLIIQIPCYNEEENLAKTIEELPKEIDGIDEIEYVVINDGSTDKTRKIAIEKNVNYLVDIYPNKGLANAFMKGIETSLEKGADIIVNIDGDHQYSGKDIPKLIEPILLKKAEMVIGEREIDKFSFGKRILQKLGSFVVRIVSKTKVPDAPSGFRAYTREMAMHLNVYNQFTYTLETIIQAGTNKNKIETVKIHSFPDTRKSRLFKSIPEYIRKSIINMIKAIFIYKPVKAFSYLSVCAFLISIILFIIFKFEHIYPYILFLIGIQFLIASIQSIAIEANRKMLENMQYQMKKEKYNK